MTKGYFLRTKAVIRPSLLRNFEDLSRTCLGGESDKVRLKSYSDIVLQRRKKSIFLFSRICLFSRITNPTETSISIFSLLHRTKTFVSTTGSISIVLPVKLSRR